MSRSLLLAATLCLLPSVGQAQSFHEIATSDVRGLRSGFSIALFHGGELNTLEAFGTTGPESEEALTPDHVFAFPALTEVLLGALAQALAAAGVLDLDAPISTYLPLLSPDLGRIHPRQLMNHTSGLDDARVREEQTWEEAMNLLDDRAMFTEPGRIYSHSRYSFPLLARIIEKVVGTSVEDFATEAILSPLGMTRSTFDPDTATAWGMATGVGAGRDESSPYQIVEPTSESAGLPVLFTTTTDVIRLAVAWMGDGIRGAPPWSPDLSGDTVGIVGDPGGRGGFTIDSEDGHLRVSRTGIGLGFGGALYLYPDSGSVVMSWGIGSAPRQTTNFVLDRVAAALGPGTLTQEEALDRSVARQGLGRFIQETPADTVEWEPEEPPHHQAGWAGEYLNGEYKVELRDGPEGLIYFTGDDELPVSPARRGGFMAIREDGRVRIPFSLQVDRDGRRYVRLRTKAFLHTADKGR